MNPFRRRAEPTPAEAVEQIAARLGLGPLTDWQRRFLADAYRRRAPVAVIPPNASHAARVRPRGLFRRWRDRRRCREQIGWAAEWIGRRYGRR